MRLNIVLGPSVVVVCQTKQFSFTSEPIDQNFLSLGDDKEYIHERRVETVFCAVPAHFRCLYNCFFPFHLSFLRLCRKWNGVVKTPPPLIQFTRAVNVRYSRLIPNAYPPIFTLFSLPLSTLSFINFLVSGFVPFSPHIDDITRIYSSTQSYIASLYTFDCFMWSDATSLADWTKVISSQNWVAG